MEVEMKEWKEFVMQMACVQLWYSILICHIVTQKPLLDNDN